MNSRTVYTAKNIIWGYLGSIITIALSFITRTVFLYTIGIDYLGINGLFTSILGVLSLTELGIGTAMNYSLYKPVADGDVEKIKSLMCLYKRAYRWVAIIVTVLGLALLPFLKYLVNGAEGIDNLYLYYLIFLFNTVSSYFVSYKYSLVNANQKNYIITNIRTISTIVINTFQLITLYCFGNYIIYLLIQAVFQLVQKIYTAFYINKLYPYLLDTDIQVLPKEESKMIFKNVKALILHKIGDISVNQTDNIIISAFISVMTVGIVSNYTLITSTVNTFVNIIFNGTIGSLGNLFAGNDKDRQYQVFRTMDFIGFWIFSFSSIMIFTLVQPFITLMWGGNLLLPVPAVVLFVLNNYMVGQRITVSNIKVAGGIFVQDQFLPILQSVVNLAVSVVMAYKMGIVGVYIGTIVSGLVPSLIRPVIVHKHLFNKNAIKYYLEHLFRLILSIALASFCYILGDHLGSDQNWFLFFVTAGFTVVVSNTIIILLYIHTKEMKQLLGIIKRLLNKSRGYYE